MPPPGRGTSGGTRRALPLRSALALRGGGAVLGWPGPPSKPLTQLPAKPHPPSFDPTPRPTRRHRTSRAPLCRAHPAPQPVAPRAGRAGVPVPPEGRPGRGPRRPEGRLDRVGWRWERCVGPSASRLSGCSAPTRAGPRLRGAGRASREHGASQMGHCAGGGRAWPGRGRGLVGALPAAWGCSGLRRPIPGPESPVPASHLLAGP